MPNYMANSGMKPNAEFFCYDKTIDEKGHHIPKLVPYPAFVEFIQLGDEGYYSADEICDGDGKEWQSVMKDGKETNQAYLCNRWNPQNKNSPPKIVPVAYVIINAGRNDSRGDDEHKNPQYWRSVGLHRHEKFITVGMTAEPQSFWKHRTDWEFDESKQKWVKGEVANQIRKQNEEKAKREAAEQSKRDIETARQADIRLKEEQKRKAEEQIAFAKLVAEMKK